MGAHWGRGVGSFQISFLMAAFLSVAPPSRGYNGDDLFITVESDLQTPQAATVDFIFSVSGPIIDETVAIEWNSISVEFTVKASKNPTATAIPTKGGESLNDYALRVADALLENFTITTDWEVSTLPIGTVRLTFRTAGLLDVEKVGTLTNTAFTLVDGVDSTVSNLAAVADIWQVITPVDKRLTTLHATYGPYNPNTQTGSTQFNLARLFPVKPHLPLATSIAPTLLVSWPRGIATDAFLEYYLRIADKYGTPSVPEALVRYSESGQLFMLHGAQSADRQNISSLSGASDLLHRYRRRDGGTFRKPLGDGMADWIYIWANVALTNCNVEWDVQWSGGTTTNHPYGGAGFSLAISKMHWIRSSPLNFNFTPPTPGELPVSILFRLRGNAGSGVVTLHEVTYIVHPQEGWEFPILFDNGLGGCETALFYGKGKRTLSVNRETARRPRASNFTLAEGEVFSTGATGQKGWEVHTGWHARFYIEHLQQLLLGDCWLIDRANKRFSRVVVTTSDMSVNEDDAELFGITVAFKAGWIDSAIN